MSYNGAGTFLINSTGQPVVAGTTITASAFNALTADIATGLTTALCKDGQSTATANLPMGGFKLTGLAAGTAANDSVRLAQTQGNVASYLSGVAGIDTLTASASPTLTAYATGQLFWFIAGANNTGAVTLNIDSIGAKAITRGTTALAANDIVNGAVVQVCYDGTQFQLLTITKSLQVAGTIASAGTTNIGAANAEYLAISGTTTITAFDNVAAGIYRAVVFGGILTLTHNATNLILPGGASITTAVGDLAGFRSLGSGNWRCEWYTRADGKALANPAASESAAGIIEIATQAEANTGTDDTRALTPLKLTNIEPASVTYASGDHFLILDASDSNKLKRTPVAPGKVLQQIVTASASVASTTTTIPLDDTIPQNTEGGEFLTATITPASASNYILIQVTAVFTHTAGGHVIGALFQDTTANALAASANYQATNNFYVYTMTFRATAGTTSATTFKFRAGCNNAGTLRMNGDSSGNRIFGGVSASSITVSEIAA